MFRGLTHWVRREFSEQTSRLGFMLRHGFDPVPVLADAFVAQARARHSDSPAVFTQDIVDAQPRRMP